MCQVRPPRNITKKITAVTTAASFRKKHNKSLTDKQAQTAADVANQVLARTGDEGRAIREANAVVGGTAKRGGKKKGSRKH